MPSASQTRDLIDDHRWLVSGAADPWLETATADAQSNTTGALRAIEKLRRELSPTRAHLVLEQVELRRRAREKFPDAARMFFTRIGLEQATDSIVAAYKADRFQLGQPIADLCCGIGGDLMPLAGRGPILAVDRDRLTIILAEANLRTVCPESICKESTERAEFQVADVREIALSGCAIWHIDPDRRPEGRRTTRAELHDPSDSELVRLLKLCPNAAIKLAPAARLEQPWWADAELEWIGRDRQCRQLVAWFGKLAENPGRRRATVVRTGDFSSDPPISVFGSPDVPTEIAKTIGRYVYEPDAAVLAAKLDGALAIQQGWESVAAQVAYFTNDQFTPHGAAASFEVIEVLPFRIKPLRKWLSDRRIGRLEIKKRGVPLDPAEIWQELLVDGTEQASMLVARIDGRVTAIMARRMEK